MAFSREIMPPPRPDPSALTQAMAGIGMNFAAAPSLDANIEDTLVHASESGMSGGDLRVLAVLTTWLGRHHGRVNAARLVRVVEQHPVERVRAYWSAVSRWLASDRRFGRLLASYGGGELDLLPVGTDFQLSRRGVDARFEGSALRVPAGTLRERDDDVLSPEALTRLHCGYRNRVLMGPSWRADAWTALERAPESSIADVARRAYCSFATAWEVAQDFKLLRRAEDDGGRWPSAGPAPQGRRSA